ncbi:MAG TPA: hypothetical protein QF549_01300 [Candidatus Saccharimonadaceae bacterium]|nr:hypothetical protein [Candidatus Saccharimonadaceae bacterium]
MGYVAAVATIISSEGRQAGNALLFVSAILSIALTRRLERMLIADNVSRDRLEFWRSFAQMMYVLLGIMAFVHLVLILVLAADVGLGEFEVIRLLLPELLGYSLAFIFLTNAVDLRSTTEPNQ